MNCLHPLYAGIALPHRMNHPMGYDVHPLCQQAAGEVQHYLASMAQWQEEIGHGKMFGVLVVETHSHRLGFLAAYSGLLAGRNDWPYFVPAVFDFQQPDGYFKREEAQIDSINRQIEAIEAEPQRLKALEALANARQEMEREMGEWREKMTAAKQQRDAIRQARADGQGDGLATEAEMTRQSQWMKAELRRMRHRHEETVATLKAHSEEQEKGILLLKAERKRRSEALQQWLFTHFEMLNARGERRNLVDIFADTCKAVPPSGAGECCAPKLLQYAFAHQLRPVSIAEFWWGQSPIGEIRRHLNFYPACRGKCMPILQHMLQGLDVDDIRHEQPAKATPTIIYEDKAIMVVNKPAGMLSVPGKVDGPSVLTFAREHCPEAEGPLIVHRLDMATSGLMVLAKNKAAHQQLQQQFLNHTVKKTYIAMLERPLPPSIASKGVIALPMRPDPLDRPRQVVDKEKGKKAITLYQMCSERIIQLCPLTGRTHQLRVHCAHPEGLATPIQGDTLYGTPADRLYLHAQALSFVHPVTGQRMSFEQKEHMLGEKERQE